MDFSSLGDKSIQKKLKKLPASQINMLMSKLSLNGSTEDKEQLDPRERLRSKLNQSRQSRLNLESRKQIADQVQKQTEETRQQDKINEEKKKKNHKQKLKKLNVKYGLIDDQTYFNALSFLKDHLSDDRTKLTEPQIIEINHNQNLVDLYHYQHEKDEVHELDLDFPTETPTETEE